MFYYMSYKKQFWFIWLKLDLTLAVDIYSNPLHSTIVSTLISYKLCVKEVEYQRVVT